MRSQMNSKKTGCRVARREKLRNGRRRLLLEPLERRYLLAGITVNSTTDDADGDTSTIASLIASPGRDAVISLREAILAANNTPNTDHNRDGEIDADEISFNLPATDTRHFYYKDDNPAPEGGSRGTNGTVARANIASTSDTDDTKISDIDPDWRHSWFSIQLASELLISEAVDINGYTQGSATTDPSIDDNAIPNPNTVDLHLGLETVLRIELDGSIAATPINGLNVASGRGTTIRGLAINNSARGTHSSIYVAAPETSVTGNFLGTDVSGTIPVSGNNSIGVYFKGVNSTNGAVGGNSADARNLIAGGQYGVVTTTYADGNRIQGNLIGTDRAGTSVLGLSDGIQVQGANDTLIGGMDPNVRNIISTGSGNGIYVTGGAGTRILGNYIGTDVSGKLALGNGGGIDERGSGTIIGGGDADDGQLDGNVAARNIIAASAGNGIELFAIESGATVMGNFIGTDVTGKVALPNLRGIVVGIPSKATVENQIGGSGPGEGNVIAGNTYGIWMARIGTRDNSIQGNRIGVAADGSPLGNTLDGIYFRPTYFSNVPSPDVNAIGGTADGQGNVIAHNGRSGIRIDSNGSPAQHPDPVLRILGNSIHSNVELGIDLLERDAVNGRLGGVTVNDDDDTDDGPNFLQNYPVLTAAIIDTDSIHIEGTLNSRPDTTFRVEFFSNSVADPSGFGEGETYLGFADVTTNADGDAVISVDLPKSVPAGRFVTSTATGPRGNTSEFSGERPATPKNNPPTAVDDSDSGFGDPRFRTDEDTSFTTASALSNDTDPDGDTLVVQSVDTTGTLGSVSLEGNGTLGTFSYDPGGRFESLQAGETATDTFTYTIVDEQGAAATATITIMVIGVDDVPTADPGGTYSVEEGSTLTLDASGTTDPNDPQNSLTYEWDFDYDNASFDADLTGPQPAVSFPDNSAVRTIALRVTDPDGHQDIAVTTLEVTNTAPSLTDAGQSLLAATRTSLRDVTLNGSFLDPGALDVHTVDIDWGDASATTTLPMSQGDRGFTSDHQYPANSSTSSMSYTITVTVTDNDGGSDTASTTVTFPGLVPAAIHGQKFNDRNGNRVRDGQVCSPFLPICSPGESGPNGWTIELVDATTDEVVATQVTHNKDLDGDKSIDPATETGLYWFEDVSPGEYLVREVPQPGWYPTTLIGTERISVGVGGVEANLDSVSVSISDDGLQVVFASTADNLVPDDTNGAADVFHLDRMTGTLERISRDRAGRELGGASSEPAISGDGRFVTFVSAADVLPNQPAGGVAQIYVYDRLSGDLRMVSRGQGDNPADAASRAPSISDDGRFVAFQSSATNLVPGVDNGTSDVFVYDRLAESIQLISQSVTTVASGDGPSADPVISGDGRWVAFESLAEDLVSDDTNAASDVFVADRETGAIERVSVSSYGSQGNGPSFDPTISDDGSVVAFVSQAEYLVDGDGNQRKDVFLRDRAAGTTELVSLGLGLAQGDGHSHAPAISDDGSHVAFASSATNLVPGDTNGRADIFLFQRLSRGIVPVGPAVDGGRPDDDSHRPVINADGSVVAFASFSANLVAGDANSAADIFLVDSHSGVHRLTVEANVQYGQIDFGNRRLLSVIEGQKFHDRDDNGQRDADEEGLDGWTIELVDPDTGRVVATQTTFGQDLNGDGTIDPQTEQGLYRFEVARGRYNVRETLQAGWRQTAPAAALVQPVASGPEGNEVDHGIYGPSISGDGRYTAFYSYADNLVEGDTNDRADIFVRDQHTGEIQRITVNVDGIEADANSERPTFSADGRYVVFESFATNLVADDSNNTEDVFVYDRSTGELTRASIHTDGTQANAQSEQPVISADGRYIAFQSKASNLVEGDTNESRDIFVHDQQTGETERISIATTGTQANLNAVSPAISADGRYVAFVSAAFNLVEGDTPGNTDIFVHDRQTGQTEFVSVASDGSQGDHSSSRAEISADGRYVVFSSLASNLVSQDTNGQRDIFVHDRHERLTHRVSVDSQGRQVMSPNDVPTISADGRYIAFRSGASELVHGDTNDAHDLFFHDRHTGVTRRVSANTDGSQASRSSDQPAITADGRYIAFMSYGSLVPGSDSPWESIYLAENYAPHSTVVSTGQVITGLDFGNHPLRPDLSITVAGPDEILQGPFFLQVEVTTENHGEAPATGVELAAHLGTGFGVPTTPVILGINCTANGDTVACPLPNLDPGASQTYTMRLTADELGTFTNIFDVTLDETDRNPADNLAELTTTIVEPLPDLVLTMVEESADPTVALEELSLIVEIANQGQTAALGSSAYIKYTTDSSVLFLGAEMDGNALICAENTRQCSVGAIPLGAAKQVTFRFEPTQEGSIVTEFEAQYEGGAVVELDDTNNAFTAETLVHPNAVDLVVALQAGADPAALNQPLFMTIDVANNGFVRATGAAATVELPAEVVFTGLTFGGDCTESDGDTLVCVLPDIDPGETHLVHFSVVPAAGGPTTFNATASSAHAELDASDNSSSVSTFVGDSGTVQGFAFDDVHRDGQRDSSDRGLTSRTVYADLNRNRRLDFNEPSTVTDSEGRYELRLPVGEFAIRELWREEATITHPGVMTSQRTNDVSQGDVSPQIHDGQIAWVSETFALPQVWLFDGVSNTLLGTAAENSVPQIDRGQVVWYVHDVADGNDEIRWYDGTDVVTVESPLLNYRDPDIDDGQIVWTGGSRIFFHDGTDLQQLSSQSVVARHPQIDDGLIVWNQNVGDDYTISAPGGVIISTPVDVPMTLPGGLTILTPVPTANATSRPRISQGQAVWTIDSQESTDFLFPDPDIRLFDGTSVAFLTNDSTADCEFTVSATGLVSNCGFLVDRDPQIDDGQVVWTRGDKIRHYDIASDQFRTLTEQGSKPQISRGNVVWQADDGNDLEIFLWDGQRTVQLTDNEYDDQDPQIHAGQVVWSGYDGNDWEIFHTTSVQEHLVQVVEGATVEGIDFGSFIDSDLDGVDNSVEDRAPNDGDGNRDGVLDSEQAEVASVPNARTGEYVTLAAPAGITLIDVRTTANPSSPGEPLPFDAPIGFVEFDLVGLPEGGSVDVQLIMPTGRVISNYYKYGVEPDDDAATTTIHEKTQPHFYDFAFDPKFQTGAELIDLNDDGTLDVLLHLVDGARGDDDLIANGVIVDPGAPVFADPDPDGDGVPSSIEDAAPDGGDGNHDGVPDSQQANVASLPNSRNGSYVTLGSPAGTSLKNVAGVADPDPEFAEFPIGFFAFELHDVPAGGTASVTMSGADVEDLFAYWTVDRASPPTSPRYDGLYWDGEIGARNENGELVIQFRDGARGDADLAADGIVVSAGGAIARGGPWQNPIDPYDVNNDGAVTPGDVLALINRLNAGPDASGGNAPPIMTRPALFHDVNGDGILSPNDALRIINRLNQSFGAEGEQASRVHHLAALCPACDDDPLALDHPHEQNASDLVDTIQADRGAAHEERTRPMSPRDRVFAAFDSAAAIGGRPRDHRGLDR